MMTERDIYRSVNMRTFENEADIRSLMFDQFPLKTFRFEPGSPPGMADVHWVGSGVKHMMGWIELKFEEATVRPPQAIFLRNVATNGGSAFVFGMWKGSFALVNGGDIGMDTRIPWAKPAARWVGEVDWDQFVREISR